MIESEAIKELQESIDLPFGYVVSEEATKMAVNALEKQVPKKPRKTNSYRGIFRRIYAYVCPNCGNACLEKTGKRTSGYNVLLELWAEVGLG